MKRRLCSLLAIVAFAIVGAASPTEAAPEGTFVRAAIGADNPSGKTKVEGSPLTRDPRHTTAQPVATTTTTWQAECPATIRCVVLPAAYHNNNPADPVDYGNYDLANRPQDMAINTVVIHDTEGTLQEVLDAFRDPAFYVSCHYVINTDGTVYQMVQNRHVSWHAGNWHFNMHSTCIEIVGHAALGGTEYTPAVYHTLAELVKWLARTYNIPLDRQHIMGHDNVPATSSGGMPRMHIDPGPFFNWQRFMWMIDAPVLPGLGSNIVVAPVWPLHKPTVTGCWPADRPSCVPAGAQPASVVYLRTEADQNAPFITDAALGQGTTSIANTAAKAYYGQKFAVNQRKLAADGTWYQIWFGGQLAWLFSPWVAPTAFPASGQTLTPRQGIANIPVYGRPLPERSEYPQDFVPPAGSVPSPTPYTSHSIAAGQRYAVVGGTVPTDHYFAWTYNSSLPYDHTVFVGGTEYLRIQFNGRQAFVKRADVVFAP